MPRFFADLDGKGGAVIRGSDVRHITGPLRRSPGDILSVRDHRMGYKARILSLGHGEISLEILSSEVLADRGQGIVHLGMSLIDLRDMDDCIRAVTELGVSEIHPFIARYSNVREIGEKRMLRWQQIIGEAVKQCERRTVPVIHGAASLDHLLARAASSWPVKLVASPEADIAIQDCRAGETGILIGPEGGFAPEETAKILACGFRPVHMGKTILRAWTAAVTAVGILAM